MVGEAPAPSVVTPAAIAGVRPFGEPAIGLRASSTVVGLYFGSAGAAATVYAGSAPIAGKVQLEALWIESGGPGLTGALDEVQLGLANAVPTSDAEVDASEALFSRASQVSGDQKTIYVRGGGASVVIPLSTVLVCNGRRFVGRFKNGGAVAATRMYVGLVMHRVYGGSSSGDPAFLSGEEVLQV